MSVNHFAQIIFVFALFAMVACVCCNQYEQQYYQPSYYPQPEEKKFLQIPALKLKLGLDKLMFKLPNIQALFHKQEEYHYPQQHY